MRRHALAFTLMLGSTACGHHGDAGGQDAGSSTGGSGSAGPSTSLGSDADASAEGTVGTTASTSVDTGGSETGTTMSDTVEDHGVTWTFSAPVTTGRFITGDPWVVCPATVIAIDPAPANGRNGIVLDLPPVDSASGWDDRVAEGRYDASLRSDPPHRSGRR